MSSMKTELWPTLTIITAQERCSVSLVLRSLPVFLSDCPPLHRALEKVAIEPVLSASAAQA